MTDSITFTEDVLDSRDIIERFEELKELYGRYVELDGMADDERTEDEDDELEELEGDFAAGDLEEYQSLKTFVSEAEDYCSDWHHGEQFINDSYFVEYAQQLAEDIGAINSDAQWPNNHIDWQAAAKELEIDYTSYEINGETYWARS